MSASPSDRYRIGAVRRTVEMGHERKSLSHQLLNEQGLFIYPACLWRMNSKMSSNETQSITQWEKTHATEREACDKEAGWK